MSKPTVPIATIKTKPTMKIEIAKFQDGYYYVVDGVKQHKVPERIAKFLNPDNWQVAENTEADPYLSSIRRNTVFADIANKMATPGSCKKNVTYMQDGTPKPIGVCNHNEVYLWSHECSDCGKVLKT